MKGTGTAQIAIRPRVGEELVVDGVHIGEEPRVATILEILEEGRLASCRVRWLDNGRELALVFRASPDRVELIAR